MSERAAARVEPARRCIWLDEIELGLTDTGLAQIVRLRASDAPADPVEAVTNALVDHTFGQRTDAVLRALGWEAPA